MRPMTTFGSPAALGGSLRDRLLLLVGVGGIALCLTLVFLGMRAVLDVGGACADGGPYIPRVSCPRGTPLAMVGGIFGLFLFGGIAGWYGSRVGGRYGAIVFLAWPALFLSLGWNFLEYGFNPPGDEGWAWGWLICGVLFVLMGGGPLLAALPGRTGRAAASSIYPSPKAIRAQVLGSPSPTPRREPRRQYPRTSTTERRSLLRRLANGLAAEAADRAEDAPGADALAAEPDDLVSKLERLAALRDRGAITEMEFGTAKRALLAESGRQQ